MSGSTSLTVIGWVLVAAAATPCQGSLFGPPRPDGRTIAQAGAFVARADGATATLFNPAGLAPDGRRVRLTLGGRALDLTTRFVSLPGTPLETEHDLGDRERDLAVFARWAPDPEGRIGFGLGVWSPDRRSVAFSEGFFERFSVRSADLDLEEILVGAGVRVTDGLDLGLGLRRVEARMARTQHVFLITPPSTAYHGEALHEAFATADDLGWDLGVRWTASRWGAGVVFRSGVELEERAATTTTLLFFESRLPGQDPDEVRQVGEALVDYLASIGITQRFDLPPEWALGAWVALGSRARLELDAVYRQWSRTEGTATFLFLSRFPVSDFVVPLDWNDVLALRSGLQAALGAWTMSGGLAWEPSPVPDDLGDPAFPVGDAWEVSLGLSRQLGSVEVDLAVARREEREARLEGRWSANSRATTVALGLRLL